MVLVNRRLQGVDARRAQGTGRVGRPCGQRCRARLCARARRRSTAALFVFVSAAIRAAATSEAEPMLKRFLPTSFTFLEGERNSSVVVCLISFTGGCLASSAEQGGVRHFPPKQAHTHDDDKEPYRYRVWRLGDRGWRPPITYASSCSAGCIVLFVELMSWKEAGSGLLDNQASGHNQCREVVLQVQEGKYLNMKGFDDLNAETNGALPHPQPV